MKAVGMNRRAYTVTIILVASLFVTTGCASLSRKVAREPHLTYQIGLKHYFEGKHLAEEAQYATQQKDAERAKELGEAALENILLAKEIFATVAKENRSAEAYIMLGETLRLLNETEGALTAYKTVIDTIDENHPEALSKLGELYFYFRRSPEKAKRYYERLHDVKPKDPDALYHLGHITYLTSDYQGAKPYFTEALRYAKEYRYIYYSKVYLGISAFFTTDYETCVDMLSSVPETHLSPQEQDLYCFALGKSYLIQGAYKKSHDTFLKRYELKKDAESMYDLLLAAYISGKNVAPYFRELNNLGVQPKDYAYFVQAIYALVGNQPDLGRSIIFAAFQRQGEGLEGYLVLQAIEQIRRNNDDLLQAKTGLAYFYANSGAYKSAIALFEELITVFDRKQHYYELAYISIAAGADEAGRAPEMLTNYLALDIEHPLPALTFAGEYLLYRNRIDDAQQAFALLMERAPNAPVNFAYAALIAAEQGKKEEALGFIEKAKTLLNDGKREMKGKAEELIAHTYFALENEEAGFAALEKILENDKSNSTILNFMGYMYIDLEIDVAKGLALAEEALLIEPNAPYILDTIAWGYFKQGDAKKAEETLENAIRLMRMNDAAISPEVYEHLADIYGAREKSEKALQMYSKSLAAYEQGVGYAGYSSYNDEQVREKIRLLQEQANTGGTTNE